MVLSWGKIESDGGLFLREGFYINDKWNAEQANQRIRVVLAEIDELGDKLSPARAEALLDEFEREIGGAFLRQDIGRILTNAVRFEGVAEQVGSANTASSVFEADSVA
jgi:hypothetical protein